MAWRRAALLAAGGLLAARSAAAEPPVPPARPVSEALRVEPNPCFDAASLAPVLARWLRRDTLDSRIEVEIAGQPGSPPGLRLRVRRDGQIAGERLFPGIAAPCEPIREAVGLVAAIALDATVLESLGVKPVPAVPPPPPPPAPSVSPGLSASFAGVVLLGVLPSPAPAFTAGFGVRPVPRIDLRLSGLFAVGPEALRLAGVSADVTLFAARADACAVFSGGFVQGRTCAGLAAGRIQTTSDVARRGFQQAHARLSEEEPEAIQPRARKQTA
jgi:hypothetical protein